MPVRFLLFEYPLEILFATVFECFIQNVASCTNQSHSCIYIFGTDTGAPLASVGISNILKSKFFLVGALVLIVSGMMF